MRVDPEAIERLIRDRRYDMSGEGIARRLRLVGDLVESYGTFREMGRALAAQRERDALGTRDTPPGAEDDTAANDGSVDPPHASP